MPRVRHSKMFVVRVAGLLAARIDRRVWQKRKAAKNQEYTRHEWMTEAFLEKLMKWEKEDTHKEQTLEYMLHEECRRLEKQIQKLEEALKECNQNQ